jgi:TonB-dependent receptor
MPSSGGMISGGAFYKSLTDVILTRKFVYSGPFTAFDGYYGTEPSNGGAGHLWGLEAAWVQHFPFLPGLLSGLGVDLNYMHASSQVVIDQTGRQAPLLRQAPDIGNAALVYDRGPVSFRMGWTYNAAYIFSYGDGTATANGDTYMYEHSQIDASLIYTLSPSIAIQVQGLDLNNAQFGFFQGNLDHRYDIQREYYGETVYIGMKYGF